MVNIDFVMYDSMFKEYSWKWLNDREIKHLTITPDFSKEQQDKWFLSLSGRQDYKIFGVTCNDIPVGVVGLKNITDDNCEYFGYIGEKGYWGIGVGNAMVMFAKNIAKKLGKKKMYLYVLHENVRAIKLYKKNGFITDTDNEVMKMSIVLD